MSEDLLTVMYLLYFKDPLIVCCDYFLRAIVLQVGAGHGFPL